MHVIVREMSESIRSPEWCPWCGYSLRGLEGRGKCPECGKESDSTAWYVFGWEPHRVASTQLNRPSGARNLMPWVISIVVFIGLSILAVAMHSWDIVAWFALMTLMPPLLDRWLRQRKDRESLPKMMVVLSKEGFRQREGFGPAKLRAWGKEVDAVITAHREGTYSLRIRNISRWGLPSLVARAHIMFLADEETAAALRQWIAACTKSREKS